MISLKHIYKSYSSSDGSQQVLEDLSVDFDLGVVHSIVGASGSGKSTLLNIIGTVDSPDQGSIYYGFTDQNLDSINNLERFRNQHIGFIFQSHNLLPEFTVYENIVLPAIIGKVSRSEYQIQAEKLMDQCGILSLKDKRPSKISGGEAQRVAVARALINTPSLVLADEPTGNLDDENSSVVLDLMLELSDTYGTTTIMATHSLSLAQRTAHTYTVSNKKIS